MATITLELPDSALSALRRAPAEMRDELRHAAALFWYSGDVELGEVRRRIDAWEIEHERRKHENWKREHEAKWTEKLKKMDLSEPERDAFWQDREEK